jgi:hypothetical protein
MKINPKILVIFVIAGLSYMGMGQAARHEGRYPGKIEVLELGPEGAENLSAIAMLSGRCVDAGGKYELRECTTTIYKNFDYQKIREFWQTFGKWEYGKQLIFLLNLSDAWNGISVRSNGDFSTRRIVYWCRAAAEYLLKKVANHPDAKFSWLEKVALYAVSLEDDALCA